MQVLRRAAKEPRQLAELIGEAKAPFRKNSRRGCARIGEPPGLTVWQQWPCKRIDPVGTAFCRSSLL
jgi:hypothetical protein